MLESDLPIGQVKVLTIGEKQIAVFHQSEGFFALDNLCPHRGGPLSDGFVVDGKVSCPWHSWQFDLKNGSCSNIPGAKTKCYPLEIKDGSIWIDV